MHPLRADLLREQWAFLRRDRSAWRDHLARARAFFGEALAAADPSRPVLILGAGSGLEIPWSRAPRRTTGWDADPLSRILTSLRHGRWAPWVFEDLTGGFEALVGVVQRNVHPPYGTRPPRPEAVRLRVAGLLASLEPHPAALEAWLRRERPGTVLVANVLGQLGPVAERLVIRTFGFDPFDPDPERPDPLSEALDGWVHRAQTNLLAALRESGASLWSLHDRAVFHTGEPLALGPDTEDWRAQVILPTWTDANDPWPGLEPRHAFGDELLRRERWLWPVAPGQVHLMEALATSPGSGSPAP